MSFEVSCSDCKIELIEKRWTKLLLKWINKCVHENGSVLNLNTRCLSDIMNRYKADVCIDDVDRVMLFTDDMDTFINYKYPILRLRYLTEESDIPKKLYFMTTMLLYHCCINSQTGLVDGDISRHLNKFEQELILKFCEKLSEMETTMNNVEMSIRGAFDSVSKLHEVFSGSIEDLATTSSFAQISNTSTIKSSLSALPFDPISEHSRKSDASTKFTYSVTVLPTGVPEAFSEEKSEQTSEETDPSTPAQIAPMPEPQPKKDNLNSIQIKPKSAKTDEKTKDSKCVMYPKEIGFSISNRNFRKKKNTRSRSKSRSNEVRVPQERILLTGVEVMPAMTQKMKATVEPECKNCSCTKCYTGKTCSEPGGDRKKCDNVKQPPLKLKISHLIPKSMVLAIATLALIVTILVIFIVAALVRYFAKSNKNSIKFSEIDPEYFDRPMTLQKYVQVRSFYQDEWKCKNSICQKVYEPSFQETYPSHSTCVLKCSGPQIWPLPTGNTFYSKDIILLSINKLEYKLKTIPSDSLHQHLAEAFKLFIGDLAKLEETGLKYRNNSQYVEVNKATIIVHIQKDLDPRLRLNTEENYRLKLETKKERVTIEIFSASFCGVRHGLETLSQMILLDHSTGYLVTISNAEINDGPAFHYRGLMIDTGRNYIPVADLMRTIDGMAAIKLNTFHWRISDVTSFPLYLPKLAQFVQYGAYDKSMVYTKEDVKTIVKRAGVRGIRVLIEIAAPGPVGRPWSWTRGVTCSTNQNSSCDDVLCLKLKPLDNVLDIFEMLYKEILEMTHVNDIFHMSHGEFSLSDCHDSSDNRYNFLIDSLKRLKKANKGVIPALPIVWYTSHLRKQHAEFSSNFGVQIVDWKNSNLEQLFKYKLIYSGQWELGCEMKNHTCKKYRSWQEMYAWKSWRKMDANSVGGEALLWTDLINSDNLDYHLWPRLAAVAERMWSDAVINKTVGGSVFIRLDAFRSRLKRDGLSVQPIWPAWCVYNPTPCLVKIQ